MKHAGRLGLLVAATAAALMTFAGGASADTLTGPNGEETPTLHWVSEGHLRIQTFANTECPATFEGAVTAHPAGIGAAGRVHFSFTSMTFGHPGNPCTNSWHITVVNPGIMSIEYIAPGEGTVRWTGATITMTRFGVTCNYATNETDIGAFTDSTKAANGLGTFDIHALIPIHSGSSGLCGTGNATWSGSYSSTTKLTLHNT